MRNQFGLPLPFRLDETDKERVDREKAAEALVNEVFRLVCLHFKDKNRVRELFQKAAGGRTRGRTRNSLQVIQSDRRLLNAYLAIKPNSGPKLRECARILHSSSPGKFGLSADAIARHLRRLLEKEEQHRLEAAAWRTRPVIGMLAALFPNGSNNVLPRIQRRIDKK